jgi:hypothetical protein
MVDNIAELNRLLLATRLLADNDRSAPVEAVLEQCRSTVIEGRMPDHEVTVKFAILLGFLTEVQSRLYITEAGIAFLTLNQEEYYDLGEEQKRLLLRSCFLQGPLRSSTRRLLRGFSPSYKTGTYKWSAIDSGPLDAEDWLVEHLRQLGFLRRDEDTIEIEARYVTTVAAFLEEGAGWTEEQAEEYFREKREIGTLAEELIVRHEMERLRDAGHPVEAQCVRRISLIRVNAGYDIESFNGLARDMNFDRFIEVKGSRGADVRFLWTENEIKVAQKLREKYWIYFQGGVILENRIAKNLPLLFQDPIESIYRNARLTATPQGVIVEGKIRGPART